MSHAMLFEKRWGKTNKHTSRVWRRQRESAREGGDDGETEKAQAR